MELSIGELRLLHDTLTRNKRIHAFYDKFPRTSLWGERNLEVSTNLIRDAADTHALIQEIQRTHLFGVSTDYDFSPEYREAAIEWLVRKYESYGIDVESLPDAVEESQHSRADISILRGGRRLSVDFLRTVAIAHDIRRYIQRSQPALTVVELGAGLGHLARTLKLFGVSRSHILLDLPETLIFSYAFLTLNFPDAAAIFITEPEQAAAIRPADYDFVFVPSCFAESIDFEGVQLFVNTCSLGEMNNLSIRYWMDFVQCRMPVKYLFTQNRYLNTIDPANGGHVGRWDENEGSVLYDASWTILKWELEPPWYQCPYFASISARSLDIVATRETPRDPQTSVERSRRLLQEVKQEDWFRYVDRPAHMTVRQNRLVVDMTMTGALFKLWESIRLNPTADAVYVLLRYLETLIHSEDLAFEETPYYHALFLKMTATDGRPEYESYLTGLRGRRMAVTSEIRLIGDTTAYNIVSVPVRVGIADRQSNSMRYYAIAKAMGPTDLFRERLGDRELPDYLFVSDTQEEVIEKARIAELR